MAETVKNRVINLDDYASVLRRTDDALYKDVFETLTQSNPFIEGYVPPKWTWRRFFAHWWVDRICGAWNVLVGKSYAEDY